MGQDVVSVTPHGGNLLVRFKSGGCTTVSVGANATLVNYNNDGITIRQNGVTKYFDLNRHSWTTY